LNTIRILGVLALGLGLTFGAARARLEPFVCKEGGFSAEMPGTPTREVDHEGAMTLVSWAVGTREGVCYISYTDVPLPKDIPEARIQAMLDLLRDQMVRDLGGTMTTSSRVLFAGKHPGRVYEATVHEPKEGVVRGRMYLVDRRLYKIHVLGRKEYATSADATAFLDSFRLTP
jgi:hypothetical protein